MLAAADSRLAVCGRRGGVVIIEIDNGHYYDVDRIGVTPMHITIVANTVGELRHKLLEALADLKEGQQ